MVLNKRKRGFLLIIIVLLTAVIISALLFAGRSHKEREKIGFIITGSVDEKGWNGIHYEGVSAACKEVGAELIVKENVKEFLGDCGPAIEELV